MQNFQEVGNFGWKFQPTFPKMIGWPGSQKSSTITFENAKHWHQMLESPAWRTSCTNPPTSVI